MDDLRQSGDSYGYMPIRTFQASLASAPETSLWYDKKMATRKVVDSNSGPNQNTLVVAVSGACQQNAAGLATKSSFGIYFGPGSRFNIYDVLSKTAREHNTKNFAELMATLHALDIIGTSLELNGWREKSPGHQQGLTAVIMTDSSFVVDTFTKYIWEWERNDYKNWKGETIGHKELIYTIQQKIQKLAAEQAIVVRFWSVEKEHNIDAGRLAKTAFLNLWIEEKSQKWK